MYDFCFLPLLPVNFSLESRPCTGALALASCNLVMALLTRFRACLLTFPSSVPRMHSNSARVLSSSRRVPVLLTTWAPEGVGAGVGGADATSGKSRNQSGIS